MQLVPVATARAVKLHKLPVLIIICPLVLKAVWSLSNRLSANASPPTCLTGWKGRGKYLHFHLEVGEWNEEIENVIICRLEYKHTGLLWACACQLLSSLLYKEALCQMSCADSVHPQSPM